MSYRVTICSLLITYSGLIYIPSGVNVNSITIPRHLLSGLFLVGGHAHSTLKSGIQHLGQRRVRVGDHG